jgi:hypothetical protein
MKEDPNFSNDSEFDQDFAQVKNSKLSLDEDNSWMKSIDNDLDDSTNQNSSTGTVSKNSLDFDEDDEEGGNTKAKIEILEITADNRTSYTEMQSLVRYMETDLHIQQFGNETGFKDNFDERMKKLDKDSLDDISEMKGYLKKLPQDDQIRIHNEFVNNMNEVSELTGSEDIEAGSNLNSALNGSEMSNSLDLKSENEQLEDLMASDSNQKGGNSGEGKVDMKSLMDMFGGLGGSDGKGNQLGDGKSGDGPNFMDLMKAIGGAKGNDGLKGLADTFSNLMKNPNMEDLTQGAIPDIPRNPKGPLDLNNSTGLMKRINNPMLDKLYEGDGNILNKIAQATKPKKKETLSEKFKRERKERNQKAKMKKNGFVIANKPEWGGSLLIAPKIEQTKVDKTTGDKDVFIDFGEAMEKKMNPKKESDENSLSDELNKPNFNPNMSLPKMSKKIGPYLREKMKKERRLILV